MPRPPTSASARPHRGDRSRSIRVTASVKAAAPLGIGPSRLALALAFTKHAPLYLSGLRHRQGIDELDLLWGFVRGEELAHMMLNVFLELARGGLSGCQDDERLDDVAPCLVGTRHHRGVGHRGVLEQAVFDFRWTDAVSGGLEHVVGATLIPQIAV